MDVRALVNGFHDFLVGQGLILRAVDEGAWDGAASNYPDTASYCAACLIDANSAAGATDKVQANCKLPVKAAGSSNYNRKAIHAAAAALGGGRGGVSKPADVNAADWSGILKTAANKIISIYNSMDETAPDSTYRVAGKTPPKSRALDMSRLYQRIQENLNELISGMGGVANAGTTYEMSSYAMPIDLYHEATGMFLILADQGRLYRMDVTIDANDEVALSNPVEVTQVYSPVPEGTAQRSVTVTRAADGSRRWLIIAASAVLNRVGEIDSTALFDSFVSNTVERGMPYLTFWHQGEPLRLGLADYVAREGALYIATGTFDNTDLAQAAAQGIERDPEAWGASIGYAPTAPPVMVEVIRDVSIPVYTEGWNEEISVLPQEQAANWFTVTMTREVSMRKEVQDALRKLVGDKLAEQFAATTDETNRSITEQGLIVREATATVTPTGNVGDAQASTVVAEAVAPPEAPPVSAPVTSAPVTAAAPSAPSVAPVTQEVVIDEEALKVMLAAFESSPTMQALQASVAALATALPPLQEAYSALQRSVEAVTPRLDALELDDEAKRREWLTDVPAPRKTKVTYRAREANVAKDAEGKPVKNLADAAANTLSAFKQPVRVQPTRK